MAKIQGIGIFTTHGLGLAAHLSSIRSSRHTADAGASLKATNLSPLLSNPRLLRSISSQDAIGMVAFEDLTRTWNNSSAEEKTGIYIGAQCASASDQAEYLKPLEAVGFDESEFGKSFHLAHPMTLLRGLTNNVTCYTSVALNARGGNANYLNMEISGHVAVIKALRSIEDRQNETALAGSFSCLADDEPFKAMYRQQGYISDSGVFAPFKDSSTTTRLADGSVFIALSENDGTGTEVLAGEIAHDLSGPITEALDTDLLAQLIGSVLKAGKCDTSDIGAIFLSGLGIRRTDQSEWDAVQSVFGNSFPGIYCSSPYFGNLVEAGGMIDFALAQEIYQDERIEKNLRIDECRPLIKSKRHVLFLRVGLWGDMSCILAKVAHHDEY